jgi:hypothetical protein
MVKKKVTEIKSKIKIIKEIKKEEPAKAEVSSSPSDESKDFSPTRETFVEGPRRVFIPRTTPGSVREEVQREQAAVGPLYDVGRALGGAATGNADKMYRPVEQINTDKIQEASIGKGIAMSQGGSAIPNPMMPDTERKLRQDVEKKYEHGGMESTGQKGRRRYPWEV